eukprot:m.167640 g.167640  ORF g.167640 m.167640 type:complete len:203 (-) comp17199_c2_seq2:297-905(-)
MFGKAKSSSASGSSGSSSANNNNGAGDVSGDNEASLSNWFGDVSDDPCVPSLTRKQRLLGFVGCLVCAAFCFALGSLYIPVLLLKARKFALLFTLGSVLVIAALALFAGPVAFLRHVTSSDRILFSGAYGFLIFLTFYTSAHLQSVTLTVPCAAAQISLLAMFLVNYIPGGASTLKVLFKIWWSVVFTIAKPTLRTCVPDLV